VPLALGAIAAVAVTHLIDYGVYGLRYWLFNANSDASWARGACHDSERHGSRRR
jgi:hypothetical protein